MDSKFMHYAVMVLLWVGGLNWGLVGLFNVDLVQAVFGPSSLGTIVYILVGFAAVYSFVTHQDTCSVCAGKKSKSKKKK